MGKLELQEGNEAEVARQEFLLEKEAAEKGLTPEELAEEKFGKDEETTEEATEEEESTEEVSEDAEEANEEETEEELSEEDKDRILKAEDSELTDEDKEVKKQLLLAQELAEKEQFDKDVEAYATENKISEDEARKELDSINSQVKEFGGDIKKVVKSYRQSQSEYAKLQEKVRLLENESSVRQNYPQSVEEWESYIKNDQYLMGGARVSKDVFLAEYRKHNPSTKDLEDDVIVRMAAKEINDKNNIYVKEQAVKIKSDAEKRKAEYLASISGDDEQFKGDVRKMLEGIPDSHLANENFNLQEVLLVARGVALPRLIKEAKDKGFELGKAAATAKKVVTGPTSKKTVSGRKGGGVSLTDAEKGQALEMFPHSKDEQEAFKAFKELKEYKQSKQKKKE